MQDLLHKQAKRYARPFPELKPGYTVRVHQKIQEGNKERVQVFEGLVINVHKGHTTTDRSFTVRKIVQGVGVEKIYPFFSPLIEKIEVVKVAPVRRAKLFFMRERRGKATRLQERFTTADEFVVQEEEILEDVSSEEVSDAQVQETEETDGSAGNDADNEPAGEEKK